MTDCSQNRLWVRQIHNSNMFHSSQTQSSVRLIIINQTVNPAFLDWVQEMARRHGAIALWSGNAPNLGDKGIEVSRLTPYDKRSVARRLVTWLTFTLQATLKLLQHRPATPLFVVTNPPFMPLAVYVITRFCRNRYALLEWDIYPQILAAMDLVTPRNPLYRLWLWWHGKALHHASVVITLGGHMADTLRESGGAKESLHLKILPNWVDTEWLRPIPKSENPFAQANSLVDKLVVLYSGNLGATHAIETIVEIAEHLRDEDRIAFVVIGEGYHRSTIESAIKAERTPTLQYHMPIPASQLPYSLSTADVGIVTLAASYEGLSMPSKSYNLMATGNALLGISTPPNDLSTMIQEHRCGINFEPNAAIEIAMWLQGLLHNRESLNEMKAASRQAAEAYYSTTSVVGQLGDVVDSALQLTR